MTDTDKFWERYKKLLERTETVIVPEEEIEEFLAEVAAERRAEQWRDEKFLTEKEKKDD